MTQTRGTKETNVENPSLGVVSKKNCPVELVGLELWINRKPLRYK